MSNFQTILVAIFLAFFVFAVLIFSGVIKIDGLTKDKSIPGGKVVVWGTFPSSSLSKVFERGDFAISNKFVENAIRPFSIGRKNSYDLLAS